jgi:hypothetical protein
MNCPKCEYPNSAEARFCSQCGATLAQAAPSVAATPTPTAPAARPSRSNKTALIVLGVVLGLVLVSGVGVYIVFHMAVNKVRALASGETQTTQQPSGSSSKPSDTQQGAQATGNAIGNILGTDVKGKSDISKALNNMAQAGQKIDQHDKATGNTNGTPDAADTQQALGAAGGLLSALGSSLGGANRHDPVDFHTLEALLPTTVPGMQRGTPKGEANQAMGIKATSAEVDFNGANNARMNVSIKDATAVSGLVGLAEMANAGESEQGDSYEKNETIGGYTVHEKWDASSKHGELSLIIGKRYGVDIDGNNVDMNALKAALAQIDLRKLVSMKDANPQAK